MKRIVCLMILFSMMLHCASRLGIISYLYQKRNDIAYNIGLIAEIPIAMCDSDYHFKKDLVIHHSGDHEKFPVNFSQAREIVLFIQDIQSGVLSLSKMQSVLHLTPVIESGYTAPPLTLFHPPS